MVVTKKREVTPLIGWYEHYTISLPQQLGQ